ITVHAVVYNTQVDSYLSNLYPGTECIVQTAIISTTGIYTILVGTAPISKASPVGKGTVNKFTSNTYVAGRPEGGTREIVQLAGPVGAINTVVVFNIHGAVVDVI